MFQNRLAIVLAGGVIGVGAAANGAIIDLTTAGSAGTVNGAHFFTNEDQPTGTGVFSPFVRLQANGYEEGYNTSGTPLPFDEKAGIWTHDLRLSQMGTTVRDGVHFYDFRLDINESNGGSNALLSLDRIKLFTSPIGGQTTHDIDALGVLRYDLDAGGDNWIKLNYSLGHGSGSGDMTMLVPVSAFGDAPADSFVYLYSAFGANHPAGAGFEEWATRGNPIPAPGPVVVAGIGAFLMYRRRR